jgi:NAD-dependent deacetylase
MIKQAVISEELLRRLAAARSVAAFTGAGISSESGVPTFRGDDGIWKKFKAEELANFNAFIRNPDLVWEWYRQRKRIMASIEPNPGHYALVDLERRFQEFAVITQNIDNLHNRAGSKTVYELHGNIGRNYCISCRMVFANEEILESDAVPRCDVCGGLVRPDVVWFGEFLPEDAWEASEEASRRADVFLSIGTSGIVYPAASLPHIAKRAGAFLVEVNPEPTPITDIADEFIPGKAGEILPHLVDALKGYP